MVEKKSAVYKSKEGQAMEAFEVKLPEIPEREFVITEYGAVSGGKESTEIKCGASCPERGDRSVRQESGGISGVSCRL